MAKRIFLGYGVEVYKTLTGYKLVFEAGDHGGGFLERKVSREDAEKAMSGREGAAKVLTRVGGTR